MSIYLNNIRMQIYAANNSHEMQTKSHGIKVINLKKNGRYTKKNYISSEFSRFL